MVHKIAKNPEQKRNQHLETAVGTCICSDKRQNEHRTQQDSPVQAQDGDKGADKDQGSNQRGKIRNPQRNQHAIGDIRAFTKEQRTGLQPVQHERAQHDSGRPIAGNAKRQHRNRGTTCHRAGDDRVWRSGTKGCLPVPAQVRVEVGNMVVDGVANFSRLALADQVQKRPVFLQTIRPA